MVALSAGCAEAPERPAARPCDDRGAGAVASCDTRPELCGLVVQSEIVESDLARAIDVVIVGDGFATAELADFRARAWTLAAGLRDEAGGVVDAAPELFNFHVVEVISPGDVTAPALGACLLGTASSARIFGDPALARLAGSNAPDADAIVVLANTDRGRASAVDEVVYVHLDDGPDLLTHELGHALFGLADEYAESDACYGESFPEHASISLPAWPNVSAEPTGDKWRGLVDGAEPGGLGYERCVYHPTTSCRMLRDRDPAFCPVCQGAIARHLAVRRGARDPGLRCGITLYGHAEAMPRRLQGVVTIDSLRGPTMAALSLDLSRREVFEGSGLFEARLDLDAEPGAHRLTVTCTDADGEVATSALAFTIVP